MCPQSPGAQVAAKPAEQDLRLESKSGDGCLWVYSYVYLDPQTTHRKKGIHTIILGQTPFSELDFFEGSGTQLPLIDPEIKAMWGQDI